MGRAMGKTSVGLEILLNGLGRGEGGDALPSLCVVEFS
jgi:hypothetical protein